MAETEQPPPAFEFDGAWPFTGSVRIHGHQLAAVSSFEVKAAENGIPVVTLALVDGGALRLLLQDGAARVQVSDETREALISLGWTPPGN
jgi:hypothetical protein